ncbi:Gldg family protein [Roseomonas sp. NAR14]|uniref:Gldg family protein n=1 Tax=Roseomonas acroporae TaxID=2937791 RepID=A0A9X1Y3S4_9PROT|nr:Gldg family protein [Roseomonas acroporae]MCK8782913.1 Gldg family protein [Roseomonas acroporae]
MSETTLPASSQPGSSQPGPAPRPAPRRGSRLLYGALGIAFAAVAAVGVNMLADRLLPRARLDLTEQRLYTLSDGTRQLLAGLRDPVTLRLFYSRRLGTTVPAYGAYADRVRDMLREYVAASGGKVRLEEFDPEPFSEAEDRAVGYGLQGVPLDQTGEQVYFGLAGTNLLDAERIVAFFQPDRERFLEYDLTRLVWELSNPARPVLGVMTTLQLNGDPRAMMLRQPGAGQPAVIMTQLRQFFTVKDVPLDAQRIDDEVQVLLLAHPRDLPDATQYAIDQFVMRGGKLMVLVDPQAESQVGRAPPGTPPSAPNPATTSSLDRLLHAWGVDAPSDKVVLDARGAWRVRANPNDRLQVVDYLAWFDMQGDSLSHDDVATAQLSRVTVASAGELRPRAGVAGVTFTPLLTSSDRSQLVDVAQVRDDPNPARVLAEFRPDGHRRVIAARVRGVLHSAFPDGPPAPPEGQQRPADLPAHRADSGTPANLVVFNDTDVLEDRFWVRVQDFFGQQVATPFSDNGSLVANLLDTLAGGDALISLRSRGEAARPFTLVDEMRGEAEARYRQTERALTQRLQQTERRLRELRQGMPQAQGQAQGQGQGQPGERAQAVITPEQRAEIDRARDEILRTRQELRGVQRDLRQDIERLESTLRLLNVALVPALVACFAVGLAVWRSRRRAAARG